MVQSFKSDNQTSMKPPVCFQGEISYYSGPKSLPSQVTLYMDAIIWKTDDGVSWSLEHRESGMKSKLPLQETMPTSESAVQQSVVLVDPPCHGPCYLTQASSWSEDPTSNGELRHSTGEQGPRQTAARYPTSN